MKHIVEVTAKYKAGHQHFTATTGIIGRNIIRVERVPEEVPDHQDGALTRITTSIGESVMVTEKYEDVMKAWHESLEHSL